MTSTWSSMRLIAILLALAVGCGEPECEPEASTRCRDGVVVWVDSCGDEGAVIEQCSCGCNADSSGCQQRCGCSADCAGKTCGPDGCGGTCPPGCTADQICTADGNCVEAGHLQLDTDAIDFGALTPSATRQATFSLTNIGSSELAIERIVLAAGSSPDFRLLDPPSMPLRLEAAESRIARVEYAPAAEGPDQGRVDIYSDDPQSDPVSHLSASVLLAGSCRTDCQLEATPSALAFAEVYQHSSATRSLVLGNQGTTPCTVRGIDFDPNTANDEFSLIEPPSLPATITSGEALELSIQYAPSDLGDDSAKLAITGDDGDALDVPLTGTGTPEPVCHLALQGALAFGSRPLNSSLTLSLTLANYGDAPCTVDSLLLAQSPDQAAQSGGDFEIVAAPEPPFAVAENGQPGDQHTIEVAFAPQQLDMHAATFWVHSPDMDEPIHSGGLDCLHPIDGRAAGPGDGCLLANGSAFETDIEILPAEMAFGAITLGCNSADRPLAVYNLSAQPLTIDAIQLADPADPSFELIQTPSCPASLVPGSGAEVVLRYHPQDEQAHGGVLQLLAQSDGLGTLMVPLIGQGTTESYQTDVFIQPQQPKTDVLFVIDNSGSMDWAQTELIAAFPAFLEQATNQGADYHIGVIATEVNTAEIGFGDPPRDIVPGVLVQAPARPRIITDATPDPVAALADNANLGTCCSDEQEAGLEAAWMALSPPLADDPAANAGFRRQDARLVIVVLSDEQDQSRGPTDFYVDAFRSPGVADDPDAVQLAAIVGDAPTGCGNELADSGSRYIEVADRSGGRFISICTADWAGTMSDLGAEAFGDKRAYALSRLAEAATPAVTVDGQPVARCPTPDCPDGWTYRPEANSVVFGTDAIPAPDSEIAISYSADCL